MNAYEKYFHNMDLVQAKNKDILGPMIIRGLNSPNDDNDYDDDDEDDGQIKIRPSIPNSKWLHFDTCSLHKKEVID